MSPDVKEIRIESWNDLHQHAKARWCYRGQQVAAWKPASSLERYYKRHSVTNSISTIEKALSREFRRSFHQYSPYMPNKNACLEWAALMQHHGAPTRLLDFSYSLYVACYFAVESAGNDEDPAIWAINRNWALETSIELMKRAGKDDNTADDLNIPLWDERRELAIRKLLFVDNDVLTACPLNPYRLNARLRIQKGIFVVPGTLSRSFVDNLNAMPGCNEEKNVFKLILNRKVRLEVLRGLDTININRTTLFPGLDGFAQSLGVYHNSLDDPGLDPAGQAPSAPPPVP